MSWGAIWFCIGIFVGAALGVVFMAIVAISTDPDKHKRHGNP